MKPLSTAEVAKHAGLSPLTLERWLVSGALRGPKTLIHNGLIVRLWDEADIERVRRHKVTNGKTTSRRSLPKAKRFPG